MRDRLLRTLVLLGAAVWLTTELLSGFDAVRRAPLLASWLLVAVGIAFVLRNHSSEFVRPKFDCFVAACSACCAAILILTGITAAFSPPNSSDAMAYHLPRVIYWAEQASVRFFPTHYLNQIILQPFAEYVMLQSYVIAGNDHLANFGQWFASLASIIAVSAIAREWGAPSRGQAVAALFCATIPAGVLASSGAKNDYVLAMWLAAAVYFALRWRKTLGVTDAIFLGCALGLALLTKATAYLFAPWPLFAILAPEIRLSRKSALLSVALVCALAINAPQYLRNYAFGGSVLGSDSAFGDARFRWPNASFGWKPAVSNALRNASEQLGARSDSWNRGVYNFVVAAHRLLGIDPGDPATTWLGSVYSPPKNANHEADSPNRQHVIALLLIAILLACAMACGRDCERAIYALSLVAGFLAFCVYLKWQPFMARMFLPLFVLAAPLACTVRPLWIQAALCIFLLDAARRPVLQNWVRPLEGSHSIFKIPRDAQYFSDLTSWRDDWPAYAASADEIKRTGCGVVGIDVANFQLEYPLQVALRERNPTVQLLHTGVENASGGYRQPVSSAPCAVVCLHCIRDEHRLSFYREFRVMVEEGSFAVFERRR